MMLAEELLQSRLLRSLDLLQGRPARQEIAHQQRTKIIEPVENLRKISLQQCAHPVVDPGAIVDELPAVLDQVLQGAGLLRIRQPGLQSLTMVQQDVEEVVSVCRVVLGT